MKRFFSILFAMTLAISINIGYAKTYIVCAGIANYPGTANDLLLPANDARAVAELYNMRQGTEYYLLTNENATKANIITAMENLYKKAGESDQVIFFFSGHGLEGSFIAYDGALSYNTIRTAMAKGKSRSKIIYADACYAGKFRDVPKTTHNNTSDRNADVLLFLSSRSKEKSKEFRNAKNGVFTTYLLSGLKGKADANRDRTITAKELFNYVSKNVQRDTQQAQHPVMWGRFSNNMPLFKW